MNELIVKLAGQIEQINASQRVALASAEAEGVTEDKRTEHLADFDRLQASKVKAQASLDRARRLADDERAIASPVRPAVIGDRTNPLPATPATATVVPAQARRHGPLQAFRGANRDEAERSAYRAGVWAAAALFRSDGAARRCQELGIPLVSSGGAPLLAGALSAATQAAQTALFTNNDSGVGFFVPEEMEMAVIEIYQEYGVFRRNADIERMTSETKIVPRWNGAMTTYWVGQGQAPTESDPTWDLVTLVAKNLAGLTKMSRQLQEDSAIDLAEKVAMALGIAFATAEDNAGFNGDGTSTYGGITGIISKLQQTTPINNAGSIVTAGGTTSSGHVGFSTLTMADFQNVVGAYPEYAGSNPKWYIHKNGWANSMMRLQQAVIGTTPADIRGPVPKEFLGYPVEITQVLTSSTTSTTSKFGVLFGDLKLAAKLGDRRMMSVESGYVNDDFTRQLITILGTSRVDINVHTIVDPKADANTIAGPIVGLQFSAS